MKDTMKRVKESKVRRIYVQSCAKSGVARSVAKSGDFEGAAWYCWCALEQCQSGCATRRVSRIFALSPLVSSLSLLPR